MRRTRESLETQRGRSLPDLIEPGVRLLFVNVGPGLWSAAVQTHFAHPANRFWPALLTGRIIGRPIRVAGGMSEEDRAYFTGLGMGIASLVPTATATAADLTAADLRRGRRRLLGLIEQHQPAVVAFCGLRAFGLAFGRKEHIVPGRQPQTVAGAELWVVPNPAASNPEVCLTELGTAYRAAAIAAGVMAAGPSPRTSVSVRRSSAASNRRSGSPERLKASA